MSRNYDAEPNVGAQHRTLILRLRTAPANGGGPS
jgi:hypothetical protein